MACDKVYLDGLHGRGGEVNVAPKVLLDLAHQALEGSLREEQVGGSGELVDLSLGHSAAAPPVFPDIFCQVIDDGRR